MKLSIRQKILLIISINSLFLLLAGVIGYFGITNLNSARKSLAYGSKQATHLLTAQNMRDNIRGLVYRGFSVDHSNASEKSEIQQEFDLQGAAFQYNIDRLVEMNEKDSLVRYINARGKEYLAFSKDLFRKELDGDAESFIMMNDFVKLYHELESPMDELKASIEKSYATLEAKGDHAASESFFWFISILLFSIAAVCTISMIISNRIVKRINRTRDMITEIGHGKIPQKEEHPGNDEIGDMLSSLNNYLDSVNKTAKFAIEIGKGNFNSDYQLLSDDDQLGRALLDMRNNLKHIATEDEKRNWIVNGLAKYTDITRSDSNDIRKFADTILSYLVKYLNANQAFLFSIEKEENGDEEFLELKAAYAWEKKKYMEQRVNKGQGLVGQTWIDGNMLYMTQVPADYIKITSGLGLATPNSIVILPLRINDVVYGIVEIASFRKFEKHEFDFLQKVTENIASTLANVKIAEQTRKLLERAQEQSEQLQAQEEEMRQTLEEMQATQEEQKRKEREYISHIDRLNSDVDGLLKTIETLRDLVKEHELRETVSAALAKHGRPLREAANELAK